jgi:predicted dehydrogenase
MAVELAALAKSCGRVVFAAWHSIFAGTVARARTLLAGQDVHAMHILWREKVAKWHPGARWFYEPGGSGVFDAGINALSIVCHVMETPVFFAGARLLVRPGDHAPIRADVAFRTPARTHGFTGMFDWDDRGDEETWTIDWTLASGRVIGLSHGGARLSCDGAVLAQSEDVEYEGVYARFAACIAQGESEIDVRPLQLVTDILAYGARVASPQVARV